MAANVEQVAAGAPRAAIRLTGSAIIAALKASGVEFILSVPDIDTSEGLLRPIAADPAFRLIRVCKEVEPILETMGIAHHLITEDADVTAIRPAIEDAYAGSHPLALLVGRRPS
jgi:sulfopyruvate decarboxylase TPP-binding subunit